MITTNPLLMKFVREYAYYCGSTMVHTEGNFHHWRPLFLHFDTYFKTYLSCRKDLLTADTLEDDAPFPKQSVLQIRRVILENSHNKSSFDGLELILMLWNVTSTFSVNWKSMSYARPVAIPPVFPKNNRNITIWVVQQVTWFKDSFHNVPSVSVSPSMFTSFCKLQPLAGTRMVLAKGTSQKCGQVQHKTVLILHLSHLHNKLMVRAQSLQIHEPHIQLDRRVCAQGCVFEDVKFIDVVGRGKIRSGATSPEIGVSAYAAAQGKKAIEVYVNPGSGKENGCRTWESVAPIFSQAKVKTKTSWKARQSNISLHSSSRRKRLGGRMPNGYAYRVMSSSTSMPFPREATNYDRSLCTKNLLFSEKLPIMMGSLCTKGCYSDSFKAILESTIWSIIDNWLNGSKIAYSYLFCPVDFYANM
ncbi:Armadillo-type fold [Artemisia annua]|uniref:Armadillo-type fold n=1 Tax=Artemisia annua TaxID=35608 RepID=A0A2U1LW29_ARTAN|nr:Armadillo-type fold [Artemisia annua]